MVVKATLERKSLGRTELKLVKDAQFGVLAIIDQKIGSLMSEAREAFLLPFFIGASPVCYGVPTEISRKKNL